MDKAPRIRLSPSRRSGILLLAPLDLSTRTVEVRLDMKRSRHESPFLEADFRDRYYGVRYRVGAGWHADYHILATFAGRGMLRRKI